jgi:hypothetical protein
MKSWELANFVATEFFPQLIPGMSQVVHQDFKHFYTSWIHVVVYEYRDCFELVESIPQSASVVMKCVKAIPRSAVRPLGPDLFTDAEVDAAFDYSMSLVQPVERSAVVAAGPVSQAEGSTSRRRRSGARAPRCLSGIPPELAVFGGTAQIATA